MAVAVSLLCFGVNVGHAAQGRGDAWQRRAGANFTEVPLRDALERFSKSYRLHYFLDRRVDPGTPVSLDVSGITVRELFERIAGEAGLELCIVDSVAYLAPSEAVEKFRACRYKIDKQIEELPGNAQRLFRKSYTIRTQRLQTPRDILSRLAEREGLTLRNEQRLPHDLWPAIELSDLAFSDTLSLLLSGFNATYTISPEGNQVTIIPISEAVLASVPAEVLKEESLASPNRMAALSDREVRLLENQDKNQAAKRAETLKKTRISGKVVKAKPSELLAKYADSLDLRLEIDESALKEKGVSLEQPVTFTLENATVTQLFRKILDPLGCTHRISGNRLIITVK